MMIINMMVNYFETRPDYLVLLLAFAQGIYGWLSEEEIFRRSSSCVLERLLAGFSFRL